MKKEKYIVANDKYIRVKIVFAKNGIKQQFSKNITIEDFKTPAKAMEYAKAVRDNALLKSRASGSIGADCSFTVQELYERSNTLLNASVKTKKRHDATYKRSISKYGNFNINDIRSSNIQDSLNESINTASEAATKRVLTLWRIIFKTASMLEIPVPDRTAAVVIPRDRKPAKSKKPVTISEADYIKYIEYLEQSKKYTKDKKGIYRKTRIIYLIKIIHETGMRPSEAMALDRDDIDQEHNVIHVTKRVGSTASESRQIVSTKTDQSVRDIPITAELLPIVNEMMNEIKDYHLFYDIDGSPMEIDALSTFINRTSKQAGVKFNLYMLRHNMATDLIQSGTSARTTQDILGHANYTMSIEYARSSEDDRKEALERRKMA